MECFGGDSYFLDYCFQVLEDLCLAMNGAVERYVNMERGDFLSRPDSKVFNVEKVILDKKKL